MHYDAPGFGVGEVWLDEKGRVFHSELPRPRRLSRLRGSSDVGLPLDMSVPDASGV